jgi:propanol-preferring alcohol dehydrogenase
MAEFIRVPARFLVPTGDLDLVSAAPLADAGMTSYHAIRNSLSVLHPGATAVVIGVGGLGHIALQILRELSPARTVAVDVSSDKLDAAKALGADVTLYAGPGTAAAVLGLTGGRGAEAIFDFVGNTTTTATAVASIGPNGIYQLAGLGGGHVDIAGVSRDGTGWPWGAAVRSSYAGTRADLIDCLELARTGRISVEIQRFALDDALSTFDRLDRGEIRGRAVLIP